MLGLVVSLTSFTFFHFFFWGGTGGVFWFWLMDWAGQMMHIASVRATQILLLSKAGKGQSGYTLPSSWRHFTSFMFIGLPSFQVMSYVIPAS